MTNPEAFALSVVEMPSQRPAPGQLVLDVRRCGILGMLADGKRHAKILIDPSSDSMQV